MTPEAKASDNVRLRASVFGSRLFRNNSGVLINEVGVPVRFGLGNESKKLNKEFKSSDYIGFTPVTITPDMVGKQVAVFTAIEVKAAGFKIKKIYPKSSREYAQQNFINLALKYQAIAGFASCESDVDTLINNFVEKVKA